MGKRARIPTQKAIMAKETQALKGNSQRGRKQNQLESEVEGPSSKEIGSRTGGKAGKGRMGDQSADLTKIQLRNKEVEVETQIESGEVKTVAQDKAEEKQQQKQAVAIWETVVQVGSKGSTPETSRSNQSWADEVEKETISKNKGKSIWEEFDIAKLSNAGYKLEYVSPGKQGGSQIVEIEMEDIRSEIDYWGNDVVCYVLGAHPPFQVIQGYVQRLWGKHGIDKISMMKNGVIVVRFDSELGKQEVLQGGIYHFDNKPFIVKEWTPDLEFTEEELKTVPIWVKLPGLDFKYWSVKGLSKIGSMIGKPLMVDNNTEKRSVLNFARILIEVEMGKQLPEVIMFKNEKGKLMEQQVQYDWKLILCKACRKYGHEEDICRGKRKVVKPEQQPTKNVEGQVNQKEQKNNGKQTVRVGELQKFKEKEIEQKEGNRNEDGWQTPCRGGRTGQGNASVQGTPIESANSFQILQKSEGSKVKMGGQVVMGSENG